MKHGVRGRLIPGLLCFCSPVKGLSMTVSTKC